MSIIDILQDRLKVAFKNVNYGIFGIVDTVEKDDKIINYIGSEKIILDDKYDIQIYFKQNNISQNNNYENGFGDGFEIEINTDYSIIVFVKKGCEQDIYNQIVYTLVQPFFKLNTFLDITDFKNDKYLIYKNELGQVSTKLNPNSILIQFEITIKEIKQSNCLQPLCQLI